MEKKVQADALSMQNFSDEEQKMIDDFSKQIDILDTNLVFSYGAGAQQNISQFSDSALKNVQTKDLDRGGRHDRHRWWRSCSGFDADEEESKGLFGFMKKQSKSVALMKARYDKAEVNVNKICDGLEQHQIQLLKDIAMLDKLYDQNLMYFKELSMYIAAGKKRLEDFRATELKEAYAKAEKSGLPEDAQAAKDLKRQGRPLREEALRSGADAQHFHPDGAADSPDSVQQPAHGREDSDLAGQHHSAVEEPDGAGAGHRPHPGGHGGSALGERSDQRAAAKRTPRSCTWPPWRSAKEAERGIVDIETLKQTNKMLIDTMDEVLTIQQQGREKRRSAEAELATIENELREKMLETRR